jgi:hypothetical protein
MARTIWKYRLTPPYEVDKTEIDLPPGADCRHVGVDPQGSLCVWIEQEPVTPDVEAPDTVRWVFYVVGKGQPLPEGKLMQYKGTVHQYPFVWHIYRGF